MVAKRSREHGLTQWAAWNDHGTIFRVGPLVHRRRYEMLRGVNEEIVRRGGGR